MKRIIFSIFLIVTIVKLNFAQVEMSEVKAQAMFMYNFTKFFDWPQNEKTGDFVIGVLGPKNLSTELTKLTTGKKNVTQNIVVKYFKNESEVTKCHVLYVSSFQADYISDIHKKTGVHCLIISNNSNAIEKGAALRFVMENERLKYDFSKSNALKHGLKFHSKVSEMARKNY